jgi:hypothetical protein
MMEPADFGPRHDPTSAVRVDGAGFGRVLAEREVRARALAVRDVGVKDSPEMPLIEGDDVVQALAADRPDHTFDVGICQGQRGAVRTDVRPSASAVRSNAASKVASRSWSRNRAVATSGKAAELLSGPDGRGMRCHVDTQDAPAGRGQDDEDEEDLDVSVGTAKKSTATVEPRWFLRNVRQVCDGGVRRRGIRWEIDRSETSDPSFNNSPCIRVRPRVGSRRPSPRSGDGRRRLPAGGRQSDATGVSSTTRSRGDARR